MLSYPIKLSKKAGTLRAVCPDFPELSIDCDNLQDALDQAGSAVEAAIAVRMAYREDVPEPSAGRHRVVLPTQTAIKVRLYQAARRDGISKRELGRRLKWHGPQVDRLFNLKHASRLDQLEAAFKALGLRLSVDVEVVERATRQTAASKAARTREARAGSRKSVSSAPSSPSGARSSGRPVSRAASA